jgi:Tfp pilus assembly protein PilP
MKDKRFAALAVVALLITALCAAQVYTANGKRDPFDSPAPEPVATGPAAPPPLERRPPGLSGLLVSEVTVAGLAGSQQDQVVILKGVDKVSYLARKGSKLFDGHVFSITPAEVVFIRETDSRDPKKTVRVVKRLYTEDK